MEQDSLLNEQGVVANKKSGDYYDIHCIECGDIFKADELTFNIDELFRKHSDYIKREKDNDEDFGVFKNIKLGMNYSKKEIEKLFGKGDINTSDIREFLEKKYNLKISLEVEDDKADDLEEITTSRRRKDRSKKKSSIDSEILNKYRNIIKFRARDVDEDIKINCYEQIHRILTKDQKIISIKDFKILEKPDDRGNLFLDQIRYSLLDGSKFRIKNLSCPYCGAEIEGSLGEHKQFVIGMIGSARVGKTAYLASLFDCLSPQPGIKPLDKNIFIEIGAGGLDKEEFEKNIMSYYRKTQAIPKTPVVNGWVPVFSLEVVINDNNYIFTFVDMPGEIFCRDENSQDYEDSDEDFLMNTQRIITNSHMLWFCIDPAQIDPVIKKRQRESNHIEKRDQVVLDSVELIKNVKRKLDILMKDKSQKTESQEKYAAILITKSDTIGEEFDLLERRDEETSLLGEQRDKSYFIVDRHVPHTKKVFTYINDKFSELMHSFKNMFGQFNLFAVASYGVSLSDDNVKRKPSNIEQPFLWTCAVLGILPAKKTVIRTETVKVGLFRKKEVQTEIKVNANKKDLFYRV